MASASSGAEKSTDAGATAITAGTSRDMTVWVWVSCRKSISQRKPSAVAGTSDRAWPIRLTWTSSQAKESRCSPSRGSVSATGSQPKGAQAASDSGSGPTFRRCSDTRFLSFLIDL